MRYRILCLPLAAGLIAALLYYKSNQTYRPLTSEERAAVQSQQPAPMFTLHDQRSQPFKLGRYAGRHKLVVAFFDPADGADLNPQLQILKDGFARLTAHGEKIIAISSATPYANRKAFERGGDFPFHILSDADHSVQTQWGCVAAGEPPKMLPAVFVIDRAGIIHWSEVGGNEPVSIEKLETELAKAR
ncbi:MAG: thioredoxin-dependent thiol peroxidase [Planctomycetaceae bacterium]|nr:thioredoxin-dependent thiol peroxidase [Planctomycetaceae bacterium]